MCLTLRSAAAPRRPLHLMVMRSYGAVGSLAASSPHRPSLLPARTSDRIRQHEARLRAVGLECGVGLGPGGVEAANDEGERIDHVRRLLPEPKMEVGNSQAMASRAGLPEDIAALYLLAPLDVGLVQMAVNSRPKDLIDRVLHDYAVTTTPVHEDAHDCPVCRSDHGIAHGDVEVKAPMRKRSVPRPYTSPIAVVRQDPSGALCRAPGKHDRVEQCGCEKNESAYGGT